MALRPDVGQGASLAVYPSGEDPADGWAQFTYPSEAGEPYSFQGIRACITGAGDDVVVERVEPVDPRGLRVTGFAVQDVGFDARGGGDEQATLAELGYPAGVQTARTHCEDSRPVRSPTGMSNVVLEVRRDTPDWGGARAFLVHWRAGQRTGTVFVPFAIVLCSQEAYASDTARDDDGCPSLMPR